MLLALREYMRRLQVDEKLFFRLAYIFKFKKEVNLDEDVRRFKESGSVPKYVADYLESLQRGQTLPSD